jgi:hypothetical protein
MDRLAARGGKEKAAHYHNHRNMEAADPYNLLKLKQLSKHMYG